LRNINNNKRGQAPIVLLAILTLMLVGSCLFVFYLSSKDTLPRLRSPAALLTLYQKAELYEAMIDKSLDKAIMESSDNSKVQENFKKNFDDYSNSFSFFFGEGLKPSMPVFEQAGNKAKVTFKDVELTYTNRDAGIVLMSYKLDIVKEASMMKPLGY